MTDEPNEPDTRPMNPEERELSDRRDFLRSLGKWSTAAIAAIVLTESSPSGEASDWANSRGSWLNRGGSWARGGSWLNSGTNWINRGGSWVNGGGGWINRGGGGWLNGRGGGGSWVNRRGW